MDVGEFQRWMDERYGERDRRRGLDRTFGWFVEEVGELSSAFRKGTRADLEHEFGDVFAWLASLANLCEIDLEKAADRYRDGCPRCGHTPCDCPFIP